LGIPVFAHCHGRLPLQPLLEMLLPSKDTEAQ
jgi:hypothetical protein